MVRIVVDPVTRTTGGLRFSVEMKEGSVVDARCSGTTYRGFEQMLVGRDPMDAVYYSQRICGMCSAPHAIAAAGAIESLCGATGEIPKDALVIRNILNGLSWIRSHIENLYLSFLPDLADPEYWELLRFADTGTSLFSELNGRFNVPGYASAVMTRPGTAYADAVRCIKLISETEAILSGRSPHGPAIVPGGVTTRPTASDVSMLKSNYTAIVDFLERRLTAPLSLEQWLDNTHAGTPDPNYILDHVDSLPLKDLSVGNGWNDMQLFTVFGSKMMSGDFLGLPVYIELDTLGGYPLLDQLIGFLNNGAFYRVRDGNNAFRDGYVPVDSGKRRLLPDRFRVHGRQPAEPVRQRRESRSRTDHGTGQRLVLHLFGHENGAAPLGRRDQPGKEGVRYRLRRPEIQLRQVAALRRRTLRGGAHGPADQLPGAVHFQHHENAA